MFVGTSVYVSCINSSPRVVVIVDMLNLILFVLKNNYADIRARVLYGGNFLNFSDFIKYLYIVQDDCTTTGNNDYHLA